ncbi:hypothetical protein GBA65_14935 [Rubrobacter marinus]|uniref:Uncharacterized protein n=1 Tax=Rubrobacter marinus TaxID=2653852 RepID=A0A6G8PZH6_9ACTN|nr:hypothetical protein [Rubrobacter marinus]QIN79602.1 hypothetical protein GBA65_14935 [Rubrobacter marinus]
MTEPTLQYEILHTIYPDEERGRMSEGVIDLTAEEAAPYLSRQAIRLLPGQGRAPSGGSAAVSTGTPSGTPPDPAFTIPEDAGRSALLANGYDSDAKVRAAENATLLSINGIGEATVGKIRAHLAL